MTASRGIFTRWFLYPRDRARARDLGPADYDGMSEIELRAHARISGIDDFARLPRPELIAALLAQP